MGRETTREEEAEARAQIPTQHPSQKTPTTPSLEAGGGGGREEANRPGKQSHRSCCRKVKHFLFLPGKISPRILRS